MGFTNVSVYNTVEDIVINTQYKSLLPFYQNKTIIGQYSYSYLNKNMNIIRIWKNQAFVGIDCSSVSGEKMIGALDYSLTKTSLKVEFIYVRDGDSIGHAPDHSKSCEQVRLLISIAEKKAQELGFENITMDTHQNLNIYNRYYKDEGFTMTGRPATDHRAWLEMTKKIV
jgi:hypothetical protein